jgi:hypothetical protein
VSLPANERYFAQLERDERQDMSQHSAEEEAIEFSVRGDLPPRPNELGVVRGDKIEMRSIDWLDKPFLQRSAFHLVAGPAGVGKGTWLAKVTAGMTRGVYGEPRSTLLIASEDSHAIDLVPRLTAAEADMKRVHLVTAHVRFPDDQERLLEEARAIGDVGLVVIDPVGNHLGGGDTDKEPVVRHALAGLNLLADRLDAAVIGVRHYSKNREHGAMSAVLGSTAWVDLPRAVLAFARDDADEMVFHIQVVKGNRSGRGHAEAFRIEMVDVGLKEPVTKCVALGESQKDVDELLAKRKPRSSKSQKARDLILDVLEREGDQPSDALDARIAAETGLSARSVQNLRKELGKDGAGLIRSFPNKDEHGRTTGWMVGRTSAPRQP